MDGPKGNLNFDTDDDGDVDSDDDYWNSGAGWDPIGEEDAPFTADFNGNRRTVSNLFIDRDTEDEVGLFGAVDRSRIRGVILAGVDVTGRDAVGSLLGDGVYGSVVDNHATGQVSGQDEVGGLVGRTWGTVWYSSARSINVCERMDEPWRLPAEVMCRVQREKTWYSGQRGCILSPCQGQNGNPGL